MITWMQHHKKWLIVTIWIATIAFVGAGFVGWGAYSYGKKQDEVAKVKDTSIKVKDIQEIYQQLYGKLNQMLGGKLDEATAKQFGLEKQAFRQALFQAMQIQFAKDNGLYVTDKDLAKAIVSIPTFQKNGKFDKKTYEVALKNVGLTPKEFEANVKKELLVHKIMVALNLPATKTLNDTMASFLLMEDNIDIKTIKAPKIDVSDEEIKKFWETHKDNYKSNLSYNIGYFYLSLKIDVTDSEIANYYDEHKTNYTDKDGKILSLNDAKDEVIKDLMAKKTKKEAIITMKKLKNGEMKFKESDNVTAQNSIISNENMEKLIQSKFLKPTLTDKGWLIAKLLKTNKPITLSYKDAYKLAKDDLIIEKTKQTLIKLAKDRLKNFTNGKNIGFIGREDVMKFKDLSVNDATYLINQIFASKQPKGFVLLSNENPTKVILFKIKEQKLLNKERYKKYKQMILSYSNKLKSDELDKNLKNELERIYQSQIKIYMKI